MITRIETAEAMREALVGETWDLVIGDFVLPHFGGMEALALLRRAVALGLSDDLLFRTLWEIAMIEKRLGSDDAALAVFTELATIRNPHRVAALQENLSQGTYDVSGRMVAEKMLGR